MNPKIGPGTGEHLYAGNQQFLVGEFLGSWRAWDGIRALDYLLTRPEVDPRHIGVTGNSGGGTMTTWLCGLDPRWTMAAPGCFVTTFRRNMENELPADTEQCPPRALALGLDHADFIAAMAPKPSSCGQGDGFLRRARHRGSLCAAEAALHAARRQGQHRPLRRPGYHGYTKENREAMYRWFNRVTGVSDAESEPELVMEKDETLNAPRWAGRGFELEAGVRVHQAKSEALAKQRTAPAGEELRATVIKTLQLPVRKATPDYRILRPLNGRGFPSEIFYHLCGRNRAGHSGAGLPA